MSKDHLKNIWQEELKLSKVDEDQDFFDLGGHSLIMAKIQARLKSEMGVELQMDQLMAASTLKSASKLLNSKVTA